ncbi:MAG: Lrp/AsnC family transcriptional regulator [Pseudomonadota bacterium]
MDDLDRKLLSLLQRDGRASATILARRLNVSRGTVQNRIDRLIDEDVIQHFTLEFGSGVESQQVSAFTLVRVNVNDGRAVLRALSKVPGVLEVSTLSGAFDLVVELRAASLAEMDRILDAIRALPDVAETQCHIRLTRKTMPS